MRSTITPQAVETAERIRDAAIDCFAEAGVAATSVRTIAERAGVSPGLVIHYFGSKEQLRVACDQHIAAALRALKEQAMAKGLGLDLTAALDAGRDGPPIVHYLARTLTDGTPEVAAMVEEIVNDAVQYMEQGVETGLLTPTDDPYGRAAVMTVWSLGALVLHDHVERLLGVDLLARPAAVDPVTASAYLRPVVQLLNEGLFTDEAAALFGRSFADAPAEPREGTE